MTINNQEIALDIENIREQLTTILDTTDKSGASIARESGVQQSRFSQFMKGTYKGDNNETARLLAAWLDDYHYSLSAVTADPDFIETPSTELMWTAMQYAQSNASIAVIYGNPGLGKTMTRDRFVASKGNVWTIRATRSRASVMECLFEIALAVGVQKPTCRAAQLTRDIQEKVRNKKGLLIIDEADRLGYETLEELRILQEDAKIGLVFIGNHNVYDRLTGESSREMSFARLFSRISQRVVLEKPRTADIDAVADAWSLKGDERDLIRRLAHLPGAFRAVFNTLKLAKTNAAAKREDLNIRHIKEAMKTNGYTIPEKRA